MNSLLIKSKPFSDKEALQPICNRCMNPNLILASDEKCTTCYHSFVGSFISFENLPLVEFKVSPQITHQKVIELINSEKDPNAIEKRNKFFQKRI